MASKKKKEFLSLPKPPVVVVLGHVDHGKTSILDYIRKSNIAEKEAGKITQHIGSYEIEFQGQKITFIDTPGHEAFAKMRSHGAKLADIALLVIAANEGIKPQTKESLRLIKDAGLPYIVVLNKRDLISEYQAYNNVEQQLKKENISLESWGGDVPLVKTSSKTGEGIDELLETILILGAVTIKPSDKKQEKNFKGITIETHLSSQSGIRATILVKQGMFSKGDLLVSQNQTFKVKKITDWQNKSIKTAHPSQPISILGFNFPPELGEIFEKAKIEKINLIKKSHNQRKNNYSQKILINKSKSKEAQIISLILKTDVLGSQEAVIKILENISQKNDVNFLLVYQGLGDISEYDLKFAQSSKAIILGFKIKAQSAIKFAIERMELNLIICEVIYDINDRLVELIKASAKKEVKDIQAKLKILAIFGKRNINNNKKQNIYKIIIGGEVIEGELKKNCSVEVRRSNKILGQGKILEIEKDKKPVTKIGMGEQCGLLYEGNTEVKKGDSLLIYYN